MRHALFAMCMISSWSLVGAQYHSQGYFAVTQAAGGNALGVRVDAVGVVTTMSLGTTSLNTCEIAADNRGVLVVDIIGGAIWVVDPARMAVTGTLVSNPLLKRFTYGLEYDDNGDLLILNPTEVLRYDAGGSFSTATGGLFLGANQGLDARTGELLIADPSGTLWRIDRLRGWKTSIASGFAPRTGDLVHDPLTGDLYVSTCCAGSATGRTLDVLPSGTSTAQRFLVDAAMVGVHGPNLDRLSGGATRIIAASALTAAVPGSGGIWRIDVGTRQTTKLASLNSHVISDVAILGSRNIVSTRSGNGVYAVDLNFPFAGNRAYVAALSFAGVSRLSLPDGRVVPLTFDDATVLSLRGLLAPFARNTTGLLVADRGQVQLNLSSIYSALRGRSLWIVAAVLDRSAPLGIRTISDPHLIRLD